MSLSDGKVGISLIGPPGSGKTTYSQGVVKSMPGWKVHDHDNDGLEHKGIGLRLGIAEMIRQNGDAWFLNHERDFTIENYGRDDEEKYFSLDHTIFASSGSLVKTQEAMDHIRARTHVILLEKPIAIVLRNIAGRDGGATRIIGMNGGPDGELPTSQTLVEELEKRQVLYEQNHDSLFPYKYNEKVSQTVTRLLFHIENVLR